MTNEQIKNFYDINPNLTLKQLSEKTGKTISELKKILLEG
jgi:hypothetical protein